jgi:hypothetical protein
MQQLNERSETSGNSPANSESAGDQTNANAKVGVGSTQQEEQPKRLSLAELFADDVDGEGHGSEGGSGDDDPSKPVDSIDGLTKRHKMTAEQVYAIKVPMPNGAEPLTIGQMKDRVGELVELETREAQFDQRRIKSEGELLRAQAEMRDLMALIPREQLSPAAVEKVRKSHEATMKRERAATLDIIPEWQDEKRRTEDLQGMVELLGDYGFDEAFITTVVDHRAMKMIRDFWRQNTRIKAALAKVTTPVGKGKRPSGKAGKGPAKPNNQSHQRAAKGSADQRTRIMNLLDSGD